MLALLEACRTARPRPGRSWRARLGVDVRTLRRDVARCATSASRSRASAAAAAATGCRPGYRVPPLMFTAGEAAAVALGLMAARRLGLETDGALAKVRRVLPDRVRLRRRVARAHARLHGPVDAAPPDGETLLALADAARRGRRVDRSLRDSARRRDGARAQPARRRRPQRPLVRRRRSTTRAASCARCARTAWRRSRIGGRGEPVARRLRRRRVRQPHARAGAVGARGRGRAAHGLRARRARFPPTLAELAPHDDGVLLRLRAESLDWAAGLLAGAGCSFAVLRPEALRAHLAALASRLTAA